MLSMSLAQVVDAVPNWSAALFALVSALTAVLTAYAANIRGKSLSASLDENTALTRQLPEAVMKRLDENDAAHKQVIGELNGIKDQLEGIEDRIESLESTRPNRWGLVGFAVLGGAVIGLVASGLRRTLTRWEK